MSNIEICQCCGQPIRRYKITLTNRNLIWLFALGYLGKKDPGNLNYINYKEVHKMVAANFGKTIRGKYKPMVVSSYATMAGDPWNLIICKTKDKLLGEGKGEFKLTPKGIAFINNKIQVPEYVCYNAQGCYHVSPKLVYARDLKNVNFNELIDMFKSF